MPNDNYSTDKALYSCFSDFYDPCPLNPKFEKDGLKIPWKNKTFVNPPYSNPKPWVIKAIEEHKKGVTIVLLLKMDSSTEWFKLLQEAGALFLWVNKRLRFNTGKPAPFPSMIAILGGKNDY